MAKMARMIRTPSTKQEDADESELGRDSETFRQEMLARQASKRRDDAVRKREFDNLRKLRGEGRLGQRLTRPSVFQNSSSFRTEDALPEARALTIQKIDAIEAHMSQAWSGPERRAKPRFAGPIAPPPVKNPHAAPPRLTEVVPNPNAPRSSVDIPPTEDDDLDLDFTAMLTGAAPLDSAPVHADTQPLDTLPPHAQQGDFPVLVNDAELDAAASELGAAARKAAARKRPVFPDLESTAMQEAAIRFAEGEYDAAGDILRKAIQDPQSEPNLVENCLCALLDVYRASDAPERFEEVALTYAQNYGRSPPEWYTAADAADAKVPAADVLAQSTAASQGFWACPPLLNAQAVAQLAAWQAGSAERHVQWEALQSVAPDCVAALTDVFTQWAAKPLALTFGGAAVLNTVLRGACPDGDATVDPKWWLLRLEALRIQGEQEAYENTALDYCLVYEVSPPSWLESNCTYSADVDPDVTAPSTLGPDTLPQGLGEVQVPETLELRGLHLQDASQAMDQLRRRATPGLPMTVHCARLVRVDFSAGSSILNWLAAMEHDAMPVRFVKVPRLVAALFHVMGITDHADVSVANN